ARPRIHPKSEEQLQPGMMFNLEPAVYIAGSGGIRHCDMVTVTENGVEVLTPFQSQVEDLIIDPHEALRDAA
ncbi:MAG TPA: M24 family metallopeptidase, partial [Terriglobales bacterium]|nr:M24 family metallopeptidase [Terriglobales bacterium]